MAVFMCMKSIFKKMMVALSISLFAASMAYSATGTKSESPKSQTEQKKERPDCRYCHGKGHFTCNMCGGDGERDCSFCGGKGYVVMRDGSKQTCASCEGEKTFECGYCDRGERVCDACKGTGKVRYIGE